MGIPSGEMGMALVMLQGGMVGAFILYVIVFHVMVQPGADRPEPWDLSAAEKRRRLAAKEERVRMMYKTYAPEKLENVPMLLDKYRGSLGMLIGALVEKYGPEPPARAEVHDKNEVSDNEAVRFAPLDAYLCGSWNDKSIHKSDGVVEVKIAPLKGDEDTAGFVSGPDAKQTLEKLLFGSRSQCEAAFRKDRTTAGVLKAMVEHAESVQLKDRGARKVYLDDYERDVYAIFQGHFLSIHAEWTIHMFSDGDSD